MSRLLHPALDGLAPAAQCPPAALDDAAVAALARRAGLARALEALPEDVHAAARIAAGVVDALRRAGEPGCEPWPPMRMPVG